MASTHFSSLLTCKNDQKYEKKGEVNMLIPVQVQNITQNKQLV